MMFVQSLPFNVVFSGMSCTDQGNEHLYYMETSHKSINVSSAHLLRKNVIFQEMSKKKGIPFLVLLFTGSGVCQTCSFSTTNHIHGFMRTLLWIILSTRQIKSQFLIGNAFFARHYW